MTVADFLLQLRRKVSLFTESLSDQEGMTTDDRRDDILKFELALMYYNIVEYYFRSTGISSDQNIMEPAEIQIVLDKLNNIMKTYLYVGDIEEAVGNIVFYSTDIPGVDTDPGYVPTGDEDMVV